METLKSTKVDWKKLIVVIFLIILTGLTVGLITWYFMADLMHQEVESYEKRINLLQIENTEIQKELKGYEKCTNLVEVGPVNDDDVSDTEPETEDSAEESDL